MTRYQKQEGKIIKIRFSFLKMNMLDMILFFEE